MAYQGSYTSFPNLPAAPLAALIKSLENEGDVPMIDVCRFLGISDRSYREWRQGVRKTAEFNLADKILARLGLLWWDVWTESNSTPAELALVEFAFTGEHPQGEQLELAA